jgi:Leucine-rich repeat (LRR) protein
MLVPVIMCSFITETTNNNYCTAVVTTNESKGSSSDPLAPVISMRISQWAFVMLGIIVSCLSIHANSSVYDHPDIQYRFTLEGGDTVLEYKDSKHGYLRVNVPAFMKRFTVARIEEEIDFYATEGSFQRWTERLTLEIYYHALTYGKDFDLEADTDKSDRIAKGLETAHNWLNESVSVCEWEGITCGWNSEQTTHPFRRMELKLGKPNDTDWAKTEDHLMPEDVPVTSVTKIDLSGTFVDGTLPTELCMLTNLMSLDLHSNALHGPIPTQIGLCASLMHLDLTGNQLTGTIPWRLHQLSPMLESLWIGNNNLDGALTYYLTSLTRLRFLDVSHNHISGTIPPKLLQMKSLTGVFLESNVLTGTVLTQFGAITNLMFLDLSENKLTGTIPTELTHLGQLKMLHLQSNQLQGKLPTELWSLPNLESFHAGHNQLTGTLAEGDDVYKRGTYLDQFLWANAKKLTSLSLPRNKLTGTFPESFINGVNNTLVHLDIGFNQFRGTLSPYIGVMGLLATLEAPANNFTGNLPNQMDLLTNLTRVNLTSNRFIGHVPCGLCGIASSMSSFTQVNGCDAALCPPGTFHPSGGATPTSGCRPCPNTTEGELMDPPLSQLLGRTWCEGVTFKEGDFNADGIVSPREVLRMLYFYTDGRNWGASFQTWRDLDVNECDLHGITCVGQEVARIDLSEAAMCTPTRDGIYPCLGLPGELGLLSSLEVLSLPRRQHLQGTIPTELGQLTKLRFFDISNCPRLKGTIPSELGKISALNILNLSGCRFNSTIPTELFQLTLLEKLHLSVNPLTGTIPSQLGNLVNLRELMLSRSLLKGPIPTTIGKLTTLENLEIYGNLLSGTIPTEIGNARNLKRMDTFNNKLRGTIPASLAKAENLQIIHVKKNRLTGTIPPGLGNLQHLTWFDASSNILSGTIPASLGSSRSLKDLRLGGNRIFEPIPLSLCENPKINGGRTRLWGCDAILCPLGLFEGIGFAVSGTGCKPCPEFETTMYLGGMSCLSLDLEDFLTIIHDVMGGEKWDEDERANWKDDDVDVCSWKGIECEPDGTILEISFPLSETELG